jgi:hypothetical protein
MVAYEEEFAFVDEIPKLTLLRKTISKAGWLYIDGSVRIRDNIP